MQEKINRIKNSHVKKMYKEIESLLNAGFYNSAIVRLYTLVNYDFIIKINEVNKYTSSTELKTLNEKITKIETGDVSFTTIEKQIRDYLSEKNLISPIFQHKLNALRVIRNFCAHPSFENLDIPYESTYYEVASYLEYFYDELFINNYYFLLKWKNNITEEIDEKFNLLVVDGRFETEKNIEIFSKNLENDILGNFSKKNLEKISKALILLIFGNTTDVPEEKIQIMSLYLLTSLEVLRKSGNLTESVFDKIPDTKKSNIEMLDTSTVAFDTFLKLLSKNFITREDLEKRLTLLKKVEEYCETSLDILLMVGPQIFGRNLLEKFNFSNKYYKLDEIEKIKKENLPIFYHFNYFENYKIGSKDIPDYNGFDYCVKDF